MNNGNRTHPIATTAELCLWVAIFFAGTGCLLIGYSAVVGATPDNMTLMSYKIWGLRIAFTGSLYMILAPLVRFKYTEYLWIHHYVLMVLGFMILMKAGDSLNEINEFKSPMGPLIAVTPLLFAVFMLKVRPLPHQDS